MLARTILTLLTAAALTAAAQAASPCGMPSQPACDTSAVTGDTPGYAGAVAMVERALAERRAKLGEEHPFTIATANALALMYKVQRRYAEAEALYLHSLAICKRTLGDEHALTAGTAKGLALLYDAEGRHSEAALLKKRGTESAPYRY